MWILRTKAIRGGGEEILRREGWGERIEIETGERGMEVQ